MLEKELEVFNDVRNNLIAENPSGGYVVIKGDEVLGVWLSRVDALKQGIEKYGNVPFLVKNISIDNTIVNFTRNLQFT